MSDSTNFLASELNKYLVCNGIHKNGNRIEVGDAPPKLDGLYFGIDPTKSAFVIEIDDTELWFSIPGCKLLEGGNDLPPMTIKRIKAFYNKNEKKITEELNSMK